MNFGKKFDTRINPGKIDRELVEIWLKFNKIAFSGHLVIIFHFNQRYHFQDTVTHHTSR